MRTEHLLQAVHGNSLLKWNNRELKYKRAVLVLIRTLYRKNQELASFFNPSGCGVFELFFFVQPQQLYFYSHSTCFLFPPKASSIRIKPLAVLRTQRICINKPFVDLANSVTIRPSKTICVQFFFGMLFTRIYLASGK